MTARCAAIIPCRYGSTRFPGKPLARLGDRPMMWHVHQACSSASLVDEVWVATDDERIAEVCRQLAMQVVLTGDHTTGTDRVAEAARQLDADMIVNVQGDEPFIGPHAIDAVARALQTGAPVGNACTTITDAAEIVNHNVVKVTLRADGSALAMSRLPIPYPQAERPTYLRQLGLYAFTQASLHWFAGMAQGRQERAEAIEMLRFLEHGMTVQMVEVEDSGIAVDTPYDLRRAEHRLRNEGTNNRT